MVRAMRVSVCWGEIFAGGNRMESRGQIPMRNPGYGVQERYSLAQMLFPKEIRVFHKYSHVEIKGNPGQ